ncbi:UDP-N-acetylmuramoyl-L-alanyl-D-glutamate--2,6-diaminopimelate ligase [Pseudomaricurvus alkylphenolicus]|uniref:UDP-N-acetylmuramoyl-L-alanyl-D-glutamate--2, 6-diaminopimelate ligase n=1 Tax=Pseudomaricurvus alkylphenolicus TaxID=1306991 RepID=UPI00141D87CC|nr:UDP-N-acetylmuramoyl-L-alanyl-D-glutamate--2,6-diaminopimelate ligase [Pseudomaricurvus alkylphenolicus]NIB40063.1 UDP-N-acetylmuramoyl-L-alanyl-D-glutamate--2,6-diaminopimelate ligase [Pseudomaricurvus alkylphenolicus]
MTPRADKTLSQLLPDAAIELCADRSVGPLCLDSRKVNTGDTFVALKGSREHGASYIPAAVEAGAALVLVEADTWREQMLGSHLQIDVPNLSRRLSLIAGRWYNEPSKAMSVVGITGTNGKTTCSQWLTQVLHHLGENSGSLGTLGYGPATQSLTDTGMTTPDSITVQHILAQMQAQGVDTVAMEVSSHSLDQGRVAALAFDVAVVTNIGRDHLDYHGDLDSYVDAKVALMDCPSLKAAVINIDDAYAERFQQRLAPAVKIWRYSLDNPAADFYLSNVQFSSHGVSATLHTPAAEIPLELALWGEFNLSNLLAVAASCWALDKQDLGEALKSIRPVPGRLEAVSGADDDLTVLVDFAHTADALQSVLRAIREQTEGDLWCLFGCGGDRDRGKRPLMARVSEALADRVVATSDNPRSENPQAILEEVMAGFARPEQVESIVDRREAIEYVIANARPGDCVLLAGKGHEDYQLIAGEKLPFSDVEVAREALERREVQGE